MTSVSYHGAEIDSNHNLVAMKYKISSKKITKHPKCNIWDVEKLKNEKTRQEFQNKDYNRLKATDIDHGRKWLTIFNNLLWNQLDLGN
jgi:hypothetical protein